MHHDGCGSPRCRMIEKTDKKMRQVALGRSTPKWSSSIRPCRSRCAYDERVERVAAAALAFYAPF